VVAAGNAPLGVVVVGVVPPLGVEPPEAKENLIGTIVTLN